MSRTTDAGGYVFLLDYKAERRWRRWTLRVICKFDNARYRERHCFTWRGLLRLQRRHAARAARGAERLA